MRVFALEIESEGAAGTFFYIETILSKARLLARLEELAITYKLFNIILIAIS